MAVIGMCPATRMPHSMRCGYAGVPASRSAAATYQGAVNSAVRLRRDEKINCKSFSAAEDIGKRAAQSFA